MSRISNLTPHSTEINKRKRELLLDHWGTLQAMARRLRVTHEMVRLVFWGRRRSGRIERALRRRNLWIPLHEASMPVRRRRRNV